MSSITVTVSSETLESRNEDAKPMTLFSNLAGWGLCILITAFLLLSITSRCKACKKFYHWRASPSEFKALFCSVQCEFDNLITVVKVPEGKTQEWVKAEIKEFDKRYKDCT
jgi:hypothetical protein